MNTKLNFLLGLFISLLVGMNLLGSKITTIAGVSVSVAIFMLPITFLITDIVEEVYGNKTANQFVVTGVICLTILLLYTVFFVKLPANPRYSHDAEYQVIFGSSTRIIIASILGFFLSQLHDVWAFNFWKKKTHGRFLWLRNNLSTMVSQAIDSFVFLMVAFYQFTPKYTFAFIISLAIPYYIFRIIFALLDTPFVYLGVRWLRGSSGTT